MNENEALICRLCFGICTNDFKIIEDAIQDSLYFCLPNMNLSISHKPVVCNSCFNKLKNVSDFKKDCLFKREHPAVEQKDVLLNSLAGCLGESVVDPRTALSRSGVCSFCMESIKQEVPVFLRNEERNLITVLEKCFPELVSNVTVDSACTACYNFLQDHLAFISSCLTIEEKIKEYCKVEGTNSKGQVELNSVLHFISKSQLQTSCSNVQVVKVEECHEQMDTEIEVKVEDEGIIEIEGKPFNIKDEDIIKTETYDSGRFDAFHTKHKDSNLPDHTVTHRSFPKEAVHKCEMCSFQTKYERNLRRHKLGTHNTHKSSAEATMYKCEICPFQTKHKRNSYLHTLTHKDISEVARYECETCGLQTIHKSSIQKHMLIHKNTSEVTMYTCEMCGFQTKHGSNLQAHMLTHNASAVTNVYKCELCAYQTKHKRSLPRHKLTHKSPSEVTMYKCDICSFQTKHKRNLLLHTLTHKDISEVVGYKCETCGFQTKHKRNMQLHMLTHKSTSEITMYLCEICGLQLKHKRNLRIHMLTHKSASEIKMHKCEECTYQTVYKNNLSKHVVTHRSASEVTAYKCDFCSYQSKNKRSHSNHLRSHKSRAEVTAINSTLNQGE